MKKILLSLITILIFFGCSHEGENIPDSYYKLTFTSDSCYSAHINSKNEIVMKDKNFNVVWKKQLEQPQNKLIDRGYGEKVEGEYSAAKIVFFNYDFAILWHVSLYNQEYGFYIDIYDQNANLKSRKEYEQISLVHPWNQNSIIIGTSEIKSTNPTYLRIDNNGETVETYNPTYLGFRNEYKIIKNTKYITYDNSQIDIYDLAIGKISSFNMYQHIKSLFPNEINDPRFEIKKVSLLQNDTINIRVNVVLYSGQIKDITVTLDEIGEAI